MTVGALRRLVLASGGVPRDYLQLTGEAIKHARNRGPSEKSGSEKATAEDVNSAAGQTADSKLDDLRKAAPTEAAELETLLEDLAEFCRHNKAAYFLFDGRDDSLSAKISSFRTFVSPTCSWTARPFRTLGRGATSCSYWMSPTSAPDVLSRSISKRGSPIARSGAADNSSMRKALAQN